MKEKSFLRKMQDFREYLLTEVDRFDRRCSVAYSLFLQEEFENCLDCYNSLLNILAELDDALHCEYEKRDAKRLCKRLKAGE